MTGMHADKLQLCKQSTICCSTMYRADRKIWLEGYKLIKETNIGHGKWVTLVWFWNMIIVSLNSNMVSFMKLRTQVKNLSIKISGSESEDECNMLSVECEKVCMIGYDTDSQRKTLQQGRVLESGYWEYIYRRTMDKYVADQQLHEWSTISCSTSTGKIEKYEWMVIN